MKNLVIFLVSFLTALTMSCSSIYDVSYDYDMQSNFTGLKTYDWLAIPKGIKIDTLIQDRIKNAVNTELERKGLRMTSDEPDFLISMHAGKEEKVTYTDHGYRYGTYWHGPRYSKFKYQEGTLVLDFVDASSKKLIWRGTAKGFVDSNMTPEKRDKLVNEAVQKTLENFPPPAAK